jgi:xanthine dehydrogenase small subunit
MRNKIVFYLNGKRREESVDRAFMMLADYLRYDRCLTGTKVVCAEGDCGACSVLRYFPHGGGVDSKNFVPINSCITLLAQLDGSSLVTVEALKKGHELHEVQRAMVECHGSQCGFCTPGFVMALTGLVEEKISRSETSIEEQEAKNCMTGNLCRCTGYRPIIDAALDIDLDQCESIKSRFVSSEQLEDLARIFMNPVALEDGEFSYFAPTTLKEALDFLKANPDTRIAGASTDIGVVHNKRKMIINKVLSLHLIKELYSIGLQGEDVILGCRVTLTEFRHFIKRKVPEFANYLDIFASPQIKNIATVVGNVANASPIGDTPPALLALGASVVLASADGEREVPLSQFFLAYKKTCLKAGEMITNIRFPLPKKNASIRFFKYSNRKDLDISAVNLAIKAEWKDEKREVLTDIVIAAGGVAATPLRFKRTEDLIKSQGLVIGIDRIVEELHSEIMPISDLRASSAYRHVLLENYFRRFFADEKCI